MNKIVQNDEKIKVRFSSTLEKSVINIDWDSTFRYNQNKGVDEARKLITFFSNGKSSLIDFYIYKPHLCHIETRIPHLKLSFRYSIEPIRDDMRRPIGKYSLKFVFDQDLNPREDIVIEVKDCCYPKKTLIKYLITALVNGEGKKII